MNFLDRLSITPINNDKYAFYTHINTHIQYELFKLYIEYRNTNYIKNKNEEIQEEDASMLEKLEESIIKSEAYKSHNITNVITHNKWNDFKKMNTKLCDLQLLLNQMTKENINSIIQKTLLYNDLTNNDLISFIDQFLGKCTMEIGNIGLFVFYIKELIIKSNLYLVNNQDTYKPFIYSLFDALCDELEKKYKLIIKIAKQLEEKYKGNINENTQININSNEYVKKKNVICNLIKTISEFYNQKIFSHSLILMILDNLQFLYLQSNQCIYFELWLLLWNQININIKSFDNDFYTKTIVWLYGQKNYIADKRLCILIENSISVDNNNIEEIDSFYDVDDIIALLHRYEYDNFIKTHNNYHVYILRYLTNIVFKNIDTITQEQKETIKNNIKELINSVGVDNFQDIIKDALTNEDIKYDYPMFEDVLKLYMD